jgi:hypothetical protein
MAQSSCERRGGIPAAFQAAPLLVPSAALALDDLKGFFQGVLLDIENAHLFPDLNNRQIAQNALGQLVAEKRRNRIPPPPWTEVQCLIELDMFCGHKIVAHNLTPFVSFGPWYRVCIMRQTSDSFKWLACLVAGFRP